MPENQSAIFGFLNKYQNVTVSGWKLAKSKNYVSELISIAELPEDIKKDCRDKPELARRELIKIARAKFELQKPLFDTYMKKLASLVRMPNKSERHASSSIKTAIKSLGTQLDGFLGIDDDSDKEAIREELRILSDKINHLLAEVRRVELKENKPQKAKLIRRGKQPKEQK